MSPNKACLVLNAGSSSLKFSVFRQNNAAAKEQLQPVLNGQISGIGGAAKFEAKDADNRQLAKCVWDDEEMSREALLRYVLRWIAEHLVDDEIVASLVIDHSQKPIICRALSLANLPSSRPDSMIGIRAAAARSRLRSGVGGGGVLLMSVL